MTDIEYFRQMLAYDPETGSITWRQSRKGRRMANGQAGTRARCGTVWYRVIVIDGRAVLAHRLAWALHYGRWPLQDIDHINGVGEDNRITNLREATKSQNSYNRPAKGYTKKARGRYVALCVVDKRQRYLGSFATEEEARAAYLQARAQMVGDEWTRASNAL
jgi:hypothetical protein